MSLFSEINRFDGTNYAFLSNFYVSPIIYQDCIYPTVEHAYQSAKTLIWTEKRKIRSAKTPALAKKYGRAATYRSDWEEIKDQVMLDCLRLKFHQEDFKQKLLATGDTELIEGNTWKDVYWGVYNGKGKNMLGKLLMQVRKEMK